MSCYHAFTDNLGSILSVINKNDSKVFSTSYDAWGKQTVPLNTISGDQLYNKINSIAPKR